jgi:hypothetical protein
MKTVQPIENERKGNQPMNHWIPLVLHENQVCFLIELFSFFWTRNENSPTNRKREKKKPANEWLNSISSPGKPSLFSNWVGPFFFVLHYWSKKKKTIHFSYWKSKNSWNMEESKRTTFLLLICFPQSSPSSTSPYFGTSQVIGRFTKRVTITRNFL